MLPAAETVKRKNVRSQAFLPVDSQTNVWLNRGTLPRDPLTPVPRRGRTSPKDPLLAGLGASRLRRLLAANTTASDRRWQHILESAAHLFYTHGYHATTMDHIARAAGLLKGSLYYYISSKEDLLYELLLGTMVLGENTLQDALQTSSDPVPRFRNALRAHIAHIISNQVRVGLFLHEFNSLSGERRRRIQSMVSEYQKKFVQVIQEGQAAGHFIAGDATLIVNAVLGMCNWMYRWYGQPGCPDLARIQEVFSEVAMTGILAPGAAAPARAQVAGNSLDNQSVVW